MNIFFLSNGKENINYEIVDVDITSRHGVRLCQLGFVKSAKVKIIRKSLASETFLIEISNCLISVRANLLAGVKVVCKK